MREREVPREGRTRERSDMSYKISRKNQFLSSEDKTYSKIATAYTAQRLENNNYNAQPVVKEQLHDHGVNTTIHIATPRAPRLTNRSISENSIFATKRKTMEPVAPKYPTTEDSELENEIFNYELSLGNEKWEDVLPQLSKSHLAAHSRLLYPAPLLCDATRQFKFKRSSRKKSL